MRWQVRGRSGLGRERANMAWTRFVEIEHAPGSPGAPRSQKATESWTFDYAR